MNTRWAVWGAVALAGLGVGPSPAPAQTETLSGAWTLDSARSQDPMEALAAARGGMMRGAAAGGGAGAAAGAGGGGGGMMPMMGAGGGMMMGDGGGRTVVMRAGGGDGIDVIALLRSGERLRLEFSAQTVALHLDEAPPLTLPLAGGEAEVTRWDRPVRARAGLTEGVLVIESTVAGALTLRETFTAREGGELAAELRLTFSGPGAAQLPPIVIPRVYTAAAEVVR